MGEVRILLLLPPTRPAGAVSSSGTVAGRHGGLGPTSSTGSGRCGRLGPAACSGAYRRLAPAGGSGPPSLLVLVVVLLANPRRRELVNIQILKATMKNINYEAIFGFVSTLYSEA
jgi:hypothetical protein